MKKALATVPFLLNEPNYINSDAFLKVNLNEQSRN